MRYIIFIVLFLCPNVVNAQYWFPPGYAAGLQPGAFYYNYPTTYREVPPPLTTAEKYAIRIRNMNAEQRYNNRVADIGLEKKARELNSAQRWAEMKKKEDYARSQGWLPPKPTPKYIAYGKVYGSFAEFTKGPDYARMVAEGEAREAEYKKKLEDDRMRYLSAVLEDRRIRNMTPAEHQRLNNKNKVADTLKSDILSGKYSKAEVEKMVQLWVTLQD